ncbi:hypothetical protein CEXT_776581 [Caerostris extrusa]|uniref:Uncharacterized protein n=1 Tax=Caerostris extrusa TaxID=172846 RepID=A0AAV4WFP7_CAEEX|nr:hypothetical protein CEXT_776581 [Caerostris extrusa]
MNRGRVDCRFIFWGALLPNRSSSNSCVPQIEFRLSERTSEIARAHQKQKWKEKKRKKELLRFLLGHPRNCDHLAWCRLRPNDFLRATEGRNRKKKKKELGSFEGGGRIVGGRIVTLGKGSTKRELGEFL